MDKVDAKNKRDELDVAIGRALRDGRNPRGLPPESDSGVDEHMLLRVVEGVASGDEKRAVTAAFARDPGLQQQAELLKEALAESADPADRVVEAVDRAVRYVFHVAQDAVAFVRGTTAPLAGPQMAWTTRNGQSTVAAPADSFYELRHDFDNLTCVLKIEQTNSTMPTVGLEVTVLKDAVAERTARVTLRRGDQIIDSSPANAKGAVTFADLAPAKYTIEVTAGEQGARLSLDLLS